MDMIFEKYKPSNFGVSAVLRVQVVCKKCGSVLDEKPRFAGAYSCKSWTYDVRRSVIKCWETDGRLM